MFRQDMIQQKIMPVYEALDSHNYKQALKLCNRKDLASHSIVQVLKAHALQRLGRVKEAREICEAVLAKETAHSLASDDRTMATLQLVLDNLGMFSSTAEMFEKVSVAYPGSEELAKDVLGCYLRAQQLQKFQMAAMKMARAFSNPVYGAWAALALLLQVDNLEPGRATENENKKLLLGRAMLSKYLTVCDVVAANAEPGKNGPTSEEEKRSFALEMAQEFQARLGELDELISSLQTTADSPVPMENQDTQVPPSDGPKIEARSGASLAAATRMLKLADCSHLQKQYEKARDLYLEFIETYGPDNWYAFESFLLVSEYCGDAPDSVAATVQRLVDKSPTLRAPLLATIALAHQQLVKAVKANQSVEHESQSFVASFKRYLEIFDTKPCCFGDLRNFALALTLPIATGTQASTVDMSALSSPGRSKPDTPRPIGQPIQVGLDEVASNRLWNLDLYHFRVNESARQEVIAFVVQRAKNAALGSVNTGDDVATRKKHLRTYVTCNQLLKYVGHFDQLEESEFEAQIEELWQQYQSTSVLNESSEGGQREVQVGDDLAILVGHLYTDRADKLLDEGKVSQGKACLVEAATLLKIAHDQSEFNFQLKLLQMEIYSKLGCFRSHVMLYNGLGVKFIQNDSLSHLVLGDSLGLGHYTEAQACCKSIIQFWISTQRENPEHMMRAFRSGNFPKVVEFNRLFTRLRDSHQLAVAQSENCFLSLVTEHCEDVASALAFLKEQLDATGQVGELRSEFRIAHLINRNTEHYCYNYDFTVRETWDHPQASRVSASLPGYPAWPIPHRASAHHVADHERWRQRGNNWIQVRVLVAQLLAQALSWDTPNLEHLIQLEGAVQQLGFMKGNCVLDDSAWSAFIAMLRAAQHLVTCAKLFANTQVLKSVTATESQDPTGDLGTAIEHLNNATTAWETFNNHISAHSNSVHLRTASFLASNQLPWSALVASNLCIAVQKSKKKGSSGAAGSDSATQLRRSLKTLHGQIQTACNHVLTCCNSSSQSSDVLETSELFSKLVSVSQDGTVLQKELSKLRDTINGDIEAGFKGAGKLVDHHVLPLLKIKI